MNVLANLNIIDNIVLPAVHANKKRKRELYKRAQDMMDDFHIGILPKEKSARCPADSCRERAFAAA